MPLLSVGMERMGLLVPVPLESGLSECGRLSSAPVCQGFNDGLTMLVLGVPALVVWIVLSACATAVIARVSPGHRVPWLLLVWCVPLVGAGAWFVYRVTLRLRPVDSV